MFESKRKYGSLKRNSSPNQGSRISPPENESPTRIATHSQQLFESRPDHINVKTYKRRNTAKKPYIHISKKSDPILRTRDSSSFLDLEGETNSSIYSKYDNELRSDSDIDDFDAGLIDLEDIGKTQNIQKSHDYSDEVEGLIQVVEDENTDRVPSVSDSFALKIANGNVLQVMKEHQESKTDAVIDKFKKYAFPSPIRSRKELMRRADKYFDVLPLILKGKQAPSAYYLLAKNQANSSVHETLSATEKWQINWDKFCGGYYGFKRQSLIGNSISVKLAKELRAAHRNKTVSYWTTSGFATHVLANEVIIRMAMEDLSCDFDSAERIVMESVEYGKVIADATEIEDDLQADELVSKQSKKFMKQIDIVSKVNEHMEEKEQEEEIPSAKSQGTRDFLDQLVDSDSDSDPESE
ncbi:predicted protein [Scheffersomyces stipitis CBS 6054]|uniref:Restriction of telomere capping protein 4 n=1 Tax=Scheffersomyces stipitis (strain ATCC 58785 / CBS 6054 / NBRC 10063 / NRRL Y-11545) TaxID=322104 RepID=A3LZB5_PICST|nr:predicted protein [Scheffersomyces stipitis CBS 6054]ABN68311.2 predicted protein [Scheffersomyces stipitis CBS 6054]KAG2734653.1 hypothetical protein G9P44_002659 [Scheffersomyces stipitis]